MTKKTVKDIQEFDTSAGNGAMVSDPVVKGNAKNRLADKQDAGDPMPKLDDKNPALSKVEMINWVLSQLAMSDGDASQALFNKIKGEWDSRGQDGDSVNKASIQTKESLETIFGTDVSEEFKTKAATLFEAHIGVATAARVAELEEAFVESVNEAVAEQEAELIEKLDSFLDYVSEEWMKRNELAVVSGLRTEMVDSFITGLKGLFENHYIELPEEKVSVVESLADKVAELESRLNESIESSIGLKKEIEVLECEKAFHSATAGLTDTQRASVKKLSENIDYSDVAEYAQKVKTLAESTKTASKPVKVSEDSVNRGESLVEDDKKQVVYADSMIQSYAEAISRTVRK